MRNQLLYAIGIGLLASCGQAVSKHNMHPSNLAVPDSVTVPYEEARRMVANYASHAGYVTRGQDSLPNSRAIWFSVELIKSLAAQVEAEGGDGIRFYFAAYDDDYSQVRDGSYVPPKRYWGYNTLLMVSTRDSVANGQHYHRDYFSEGGVVAKSEKAGFIINRGNVCCPDCWDDPSLFDPETSAACN
ncbi:hypothetical protein [Parapedobacter sp. 2B3]|uniref:hypothetical protein n=1 Tax=Parapedobacter sp. 2B3 TaxID=3342381 RepID=UPI0035B691CE